MLKKFGALIRLVSALPHKTDQETPKSLSSSILGIAKDERVPISALKLRVIDSSIGCHFLSLQDWSNTVNSISYQS